MSGITEARRKKQLRSRRARFRGAMRGRPVVMGMAACAVSTAILWSLAANHRPHPDGPAFHPLRGLPTSNPPESPEG